MNNQNRFNKYLIGLGISLILLIAYIIVVLIALPVVLIVAPKVRPILDPPREIVLSSLPAQVLWQIEIDESVNKKPVIIDNQVIVSTSQAIYGIDIKTGQEIWRHIPRNQPSVTPQVTKNRVIYGNRIGQVTALDTATGEIIWQYKLSKGRDINSMDIGDRIVYIATTPSTFLYALDSKTGKLVWHVNGYDHNIPSRGARIRLWRDELYVFTTKTHILDARTGQVKQSLSQEFLTTQVANDKFYTSRSVRKVGTFELVSELTSPSYKLLDDNCESFRMPYIFSETMYYAAGQCGGVYALDIKSNRIKWAYYEEVRAETPIAIYRDSVYALFDNGEIHAIDSQTGQSQGILKANRGLPGTANLLSRGVVANEDVLIATFNDRSVWAFCEPPCF